MNKEKLKQVFREVINEYNSVNNCPDFEISMDQAKQILGVTYPTVRKYLREGILKDLTENGRSKFSFFDVLKLKNENIKYRRGFDI